MKKPVWVIEDNYAVFALIRKFIAECGYQIPEIIQYKSIEEIEDTAPQPAMIFVDCEYSDVAQPYANSFFNTTYAAIPVVLLATNDNDGTRKQAIAIKATDYLIKSELTLSLFRKCVQYALSRKEILNKLQESHNDYLGIFQKHPLPMWVFEISTLNFVTVNDAAIHYYGYSREEFLKMTIADIRPVEDHDALKQTVARTDVSGFYDNNHWTHVKKNGEQMRVHIFSNSITFQDKECKMVAVVNINRQQELEELVKTLTKSL